MIGQILVELGSTERISRYRPHNFPGNADRGLTADRSRDDWIRVRCAPLISLLVPISDPGRDAISGRLKSVLSKSMTSDQQRYVHPGSGLFLHRTDYGRQREPGTSRNPDPKPYEPDPDPGLLVNRSTAGRLREPAILGIPFRAPMIQSLDSS